jgi:hypothetical protein
MNKIILAKSLTLIIPGFLTVAGMINPRSGSGAGQAGKGLVLTFSWVAPYIPWAACKNTIQGSGAVMARVIHRLGAGLPFKMKNNV